MTTRLSAIELAIRQESYERLVEDELLRLARAFLKDPEVNAQLFAAHVGGALPPPSSLDTEPTLEAMLDRASPSGLKLFRLGSIGSFRVPAPKAKSFLRMLLLPAAREAARLTFAGTEKEPTTRELLVGRREVLSNAGRVDEAAVLEVAEDDEAAEWVDEHRPNIFQGGAFPELDDAEEFTAPDDNERLEARERAVRACAELIELLCACDVRRKEWPADVAALGDEIDTMIAAGFGVRKNTSGPLTRAIYEAVAAAFTGVSETRDFVHYAYTGKIMELAGLVQAKKGRSRVERVTRALSRERQAKHPTANASDGDDPTSVSKH